MTDIIINEIVTFTFSKWSC